VALGERESATDDEEVAVLEDVTEDAGRSPAFLSMRGDSYLYLDGKKSFEIVRLKHYDLRHRSRRKDLF